MINPTFKYESPAGTYEIIHRSDMGYWVHFSNEHLTLVGEPRHDFLSVLKLAIDRIEQDHHLAAINLSKG
jgi:hypothetical protein